MRRWTHPQPIQTALVASERSLSRGTHTPGRRVAALRKRERSHVRAERGVAGDVRAVAVNVEVLAGLESPRASLVYDVGNENRSAVAEPVGPILYEPHIHDRPPL